MKTEETKTAFRIVRLKNDVVLCSGDKEEEVIMKGAIGIIVDDVEMYFSRKAFSKTYTSYPARFDSKEFIEEYKEDIEYLEEFDYIKI
jgi:hypothetical protein